MPRIARLVIPGIPHHVVQRGVRSMQVFRSDVDRQHYLQIMREQADERGLSFLGWCLMTNHVHLVVIPKDEASLARAIGEAHRRYTRWINLQEKTRGYLFQGRFHSTPLDEKHTIAALRYVERNPVRAGMAKQAWDYAWSSARFHLGKADEDPLLNEKDPLRILQDWKEMLKVEPEETALFRRNIQSGLPCGDKPFIKRLESKAGRSLSHRPPGRPRA